MRRLALIALGALCACAGPAWQRVPHDVPYQRAPEPALHAPPRVIERLESWGMIRQTTVRPLGESANPGYWVERAIGMPPALDANDFGQVPDSTWFENRIGRHDLTPEEVARGPNRHDGPADGPLVIIDGKIEGATPGFVVQDNRGDRYVVKFDPPAFPELASGAEIIATKILWASGYHTPENYVLRFDLGRLMLSPDAKTAGPHGDPIPLTQDMVRDLVAHVNPYPDGTIRALFSRIVPGKLLGPFEYEGRRFDDPNDDIPHERRRSLRGLWLLSAWINNVDTRASNSLDVFVEVEPGSDLGYVKHFLIDFGDALGSAGTGPKYIGEGYEGLIDWSMIARGFFSAGLWYRYWLPVQRSPYRAVGVYEAKVFDPDRWNPRIPNPAFDAATPLDTYWAASLVARFDVEDLIAIVRTARYSDPAAEAWVLRVLLQRQYAILTWAFERVLPLDAPRVEGGYTLALEDLAVRAALLSAEQVGYDWALTWRGDEVARGQDFVPRADLEGAIAELRADPAALERDPFVTVTFRRPLPTEGAPSMQVHLRVLPEGLLPVGVSREVQ